MNYLYWKPYSSENERVNTIFPGAFTIDGDSSARGKENLLDSPEPFDHWDPDNKAIYLHPGSPVTDHLDCYKTRVVSRRLKEFLGEFIGTEAQFLPILLEAEDASETIRDYFIMHVVATADYLDLERTDHHPVAGKGPEVIVTPPIVLRRDKIPPELHVIRDKRLYGNDLIIREDLAKALKKAKFTGLLFAKCQYS